MAVKLEQDGYVTTVVHSRPEARNAMDPESADALVDAFLGFERTTMRAWQFCGAKAERSVPAGI